MRIAGVMLEPFLPQKMAELRVALKQNDGAPLAKRVAWGGLTAGTVLDKCALFPRLEA